MNKAWNNILATDINFEINIISMLLILISFFFTNILNPQNQLSYKQALNCF